jgi:hypothetical protein
LGACGRRIVNSQIAWETEQEDPILKTTTTTTTKKTKESLLPFPVWGTGNVSLFLPLTTLSAFYPVILK